MVFEVLEMAEMSHKRCKRRPEWSPGQKWAHRRGTRKEKQKRMGQLQDLNAVEWLDMKTCVH